MASSVLKKKVDEVQALEMGENTLEEEDMLQFKGGTERDILQLVMRDALCVHVVVKALRGKGRPHIEAVLNNLDRPADNPFQKGENEFSPKGGTERDILQFAIEKAVLQDSKFQEPASEILTALDTLLGHKSPFLDVLLQLAESKRFDWRTLPAPVQP